MAFKFKSRSRSTERAVGRARDEQRGERGGNHDHAAVDDADVRAVRDLAVHVEQQAAETATGGAERRGDPPRDTLTVRR